MPNTAYSTAKFAVKGFTEALIEDQQRTLAELIRRGVLPEGRLRR